MKTGKTPYEIRLELLQLAEKVLNEQYTAKIIKDEIMPAGSRVFPEGPTTEEIIAEATKMNAFVCKDRD